MRPPPWAQLDFNFSLLHLIAGSVSLNPGPGVHGLCLRAINAYPMWDKVPSLSDLVANKGIDLLGITETGLTTKETSVDIADMTPMVSPSFMNLEHDGEGEEWACLCHQPINLQQSVYQPKQVSRPYRANLNVVSHALLSSISIAYRVLLLLSSVSYKIFCPTYLHYVMIWLWWGTSIFVSIPHHPMPDSYLVFWSLSISINALTFLPTFMVILSTRYDLFFGTWISDHFSVVDNLQMLIPS